MESRIGKLIEVHDQQEGSVGLFKIVGNLCPEDHLKTVLKEYFEMESEDSKVMHLCIWGIEEINVDYKINI